MLIPNQPSLAEIAAIVDGMAILNKDCMREPSGTVNRTIQMGQKLAINQLRKCLVSKLGLSRDVDQAEAICYLMHALEALESPSLLEVSIR